MKRKKYLSLFFLLIGCALLMTCCVSPETRWKYFIERNAHSSAASAYLAETSELTEIRDAQTGNQIPDAYIIILESRYSERTDVAAASGKSKRTHLVHVVPFSSIHEFKTKTGNSSGVVFWFYRYGSFLDGYAFSKGYYPIRLTKSNISFFRDSTQITKEEFVAETGKEPDGLAGLHHNGHKYVKVRQFPSEVYLSPFVDDDSDIIDHLIALVHQNNAYQEWSNLDKSIRKKVEKILK